MMADLRKAVYPVVLLQLASGGYIAYLYDFKQITEGEDVPDAMAMARDAIGLLGTDSIMDGSLPPCPSRLEDVKKETLNQLVAKFSAVDKIVTFVDIDFKKYEKQMGERAAKVTCTIPASLKKQAVKAGLKFSKILREGIRAELGKTSGKESER